MDIAKLNEIIEKKLTTNRSVENAVLVSDENETINNPIQEWNEDSVIDMALMMRILNAKAQNNLNWSGCEQMWLHSKDSYFVAVRCSKGVLLLIQANNAVPLGGLRMIIYDTVKALEAELGSEEPFTPEAKPNNINSSIYTPTELETDFETDDGEMIWRGRRKKKENQAET